MRKLLKTLLKVSPFGLLCFGLILACGCSTPQVAEGDAATAEGSLAAGISAVESGDYAGALPQLTTAIDSPGLNVDQYVEALLLRAQCYVHVGEVDKAEADIAEAEQGAADEALLAYTQAMLYFKKGDTAAGNKAFSAARKVDKSLKKPTF